MSVHDLQLHSESYINFFLSVSGSCYQWMIPFIILSALCCYFICVLLALIWKGYITLHCKKDRGAAGPHNQQEAVQLNTRREAV